MARIYNIEDDLTVSDSCLCFLKPGTEVLEFGSATGYATRYMKEKLGCKVTCIEKIPEMVEMGRTISDKIIQADVESDFWENELDQQYDFIMFADILEHLVNPSAVIARAKPFLKVNGFILTSIPNIGHNAILLNLRKGIFDYTETGLLDNTHIHFMTRKSIQDIFIANGLQCVAEESKIIRPSDTEFRIHYCQSPLLSLSIIRKPDGHVYRFVQAWSTISDSNVNSRERSQNEYMQSQEFKLGFWKAKLELAYDLASYFKRKLHWETPSWIRNGVQKSMIDQDDKRYDKYKN